MAHDSAERADGVALGPPAARDRYVVIDGVGHAFRRQQLGSLEVLRDVNLTIGRGEFVVLVGPSGCGKSTLLSMVAGLLRPAQGTITIDGQPVSGPSPHLGMVFQRPLLLKWRTTLDNVLLQAEMRGLPRRAHVDHARELLAQVDLAAFEHCLPHELSGGMQQRVALCRALIHQPTLLLMDEPFAALDALTREQMALDLQHLGLSRGVAVLFVTHSITEAVLLGNRIVVMSARPGHIAGVVEPALERPIELAEMSSRAFGDACATVRELLVREGAFGRPNAAVSGVASYSVSQSD
jgi:NitT/TauT family transport system ATP-binding protein